MSRIFTILILLGLAAGCQPEAEPVTIIKSWQLVSVEAGSFGEITTGLENSTITFREDGKVEFTDMNGDSFEANWKLDENGELITVSFDEIPDFGMDIPNTPEPDILRWEIIELEIESMVLLQELDVDTFGSISLTYTLEVIP